VIIRHSTSPIANTLKSTGRTFSNITSNYESFGVVSESTVQIGGKELNGLFVNQILLVGSEFVKESKEILLEEFNSEFFIRIGNKVDDLLLDSEFFDLYRHKGSHE
jgi:hypothetical protein